MIKGLIKNVQLSETLSIIHHRRSNQKQKTETGIGMKEKTKLIIHRYSTE